MSIGPVEGLAAGAAGSPRAEAGSQAADRAAQEAAADSRKIDRQKQAANAAGVGEPGETQNTSEDRDPDGQRPWQPAARHIDEEPTSKQPLNNTSDDRSRLLDLSG